MKYEILCFSIGLVIGEMIGMAGGLAHQAGVTSFPRIAVVGLVFGALLGALLALLIAFGGHYLYGPAVLAGMFIGGVSGVVVAVFALNLPTLRLSLLVGTLLGGLIGYALCRLCRLHRRFSHQS